MLRKARHPTNVDLIEAFRKRSIVQLSSITPKWAYGLNVIHLHDYIQHPKENVYTVFLSRTEELIKLGDFGEVNLNQLFTGDPKNDFRIARILDRWENCFFVDPPAIGLNYSNCGILFTDGRHRTKTAYILGHQFIPIAVDNQQIDIVRRLIHLFPAT